MDDFSPIVRDPRRWQAFLLGISANGAPSRHAIAKILTLAECRSVIDFGCGPALLYDLLPSGTSYVGIDASPAMAEKARERLEALDAQDTTPAVSKRTYNIFTGGADFLSGFKGPAAKDAVVLRHVLEHVQEPEPIIRAACAAARKRILVALSVPALAASAESCFNDAFLGVPRWRHGVERLARAFRGNNLDGGGTWTLRRIMDVPLPHGEELFSAESGPL